MSHATRTALAAALATVLLAAACERVPVDDGPVLTGDYLGQTPPTDGPAIFAPGLVNRGLACRDLVVSPDGDEIMWSEQVGGFRHSVVLRSRRADDTWGEPETAPFSGDPRWRDIEPSFSPDGLRLYFASDRPAAGDGPAEADLSLWVCIHDGHDWGAPERLPDNVNEGATFFPSVTADGTLYFTRDEAGGVSSIWRARPDGDGYAAPERLPDQVNAGRTRFNAVVAADESFVIVPVFGLEDTFGGVDYYLVRRNPDDTWEDPVNLGPAVNGEARQEWSASLSPDGAHLFFMSDRPDTALTRHGRLTTRRLRDLHNAPGTGQIGIWWVPIRLIPTFEI